MAWGGQGRKSDYRRLDTVGFDVVDARMGQILAEIRKENVDRYPERTASDKAAEEFGVAEFNLRMWVRRQRTITFLAEAEPGEILDMIACGQSPADIAIEYDVSVRVIEHWITEHCKSEDIANAKDSMADAKFARVRREIEDARNDFEIKKSAAIHAIDRHVATTSRRYSEDKNIRINAGAGTAMEISFVRKRPQPEPETSDG
jgi:hypothetical protein